MKKSSARPDAAALVWLAVFNREDGDVTALRREVERLVRGQSRADTERLVRTLAWLAGAMAARIPEAARDEILTAFETSPLLAFMGV